MEEGQDLWQALILWKKITGQTSVKVTDLSLHVHLLKRELWRISLWGKPDLGNLIWSRIPLCLFAVAEVVPSQKRYLSVQTRLLLSQEKMKDMQNWWTPVSLFWAQRKRQQAPEPISAQGGGAGNKTTKGSRQG